MKFCSKQFFFALRDPFLGFVLALAFALTAWLATPPPPSDISNESAIEIELDLHSDSPPSPLLEITEEEAVAPPPPEWNRYVVKKRDTMAKALSAIGTDEEARQFLLTKRMKTYRKLRLGTAIEYKKDGDGFLIALRYKTSPDYYLQFIRDESGMRATEDPPLLSAATEHRAGEIESSLFAATDLAGIPDAAVIQLIDALETRIDFHRDLRRGDSFRLIYTAHRDEDDELKKVGALAGFVFINRGKEIVGIHDKENGGFYTPEGVSLRRAFLRSPVRFSRISSRFSNRRFHPVLKKWRAHRGVDYAAARGTPVRATGDGYVSFAGRKGGYGKTVFLRHAGNYTTVYGHLHRIAKGIRKGAKIVQGRVIGKVGSTGLATGPHLHYEFRVRGVHKNPLSAAVPVQLPPLKGNALRDFQARAKSVIAELKAIPVGENTATAAK